MEIEYTEYLIEYLAKTIFPWSPVICLLVAFLFFFLLDRINLDKAKKWRKLNLAKKIKTIIFYLEIICIAPILFFFLLSSFLSFLYEPKYFCSTGIGFMIAWSFLLLAGIQLYVFLIVVGLLLYEKFKRQ